MLSKSAWLWTPPNADYRQILQQFSIYNRALATNLPFPKTRRIVFLGNRPATLPGWAETGASSSTGDSCLCSFAGSDNTVRCWMGKCNSRFLMRHCFSPLNSRRTRDDRQATRPRPAGPHSQRSNDRCSPVPSSSCCSTRSPVRWPPPRSKTRRSARKRNRRWRILENGSNITLGIPFEDVVADLGFTMGSDPRLQGSRLRRIIFSD